MARKVFNRRSLRNKESKAMRLNKEKFDQATALAKQRQEAKNMLDYLRGMNSFDMVLGSRKPVAVYGSLKDSLAVGFLVEIDKIDAKLHKLDIELKD